MWDKPLMFTELAVIYIVNHKKFLTKRKAEIYLAELEIKEIERRLADVE